MTDESLLRRQIAEFGASLFSRGFSVGSAGNISVRIEGGYLMTPTNSSLGRLDPDDATSLLRLRRNRAQGLALVLDVDSFAQPGTGSGSSVMGADAAGGGDARTEVARTRQRDEHRLAVQMLRDHQWRVIEVGRGMSVADAWAGLEQLGAVA